MKDGSYGGGVRRNVTSSRLWQFMESLAAAARGPGTVYFTGGATALLLGLREQTVDIDLKLDPEPAGVFEAIAKLKDSMDINVELASPDDFIPASSNWREHSRHIATIGALQFFHYDLALQALAKIERGHAQDLDDARGFLRAGHIATEELRRRFGEIEGKLVRYPAIDSDTFKRRVEDFLKAEENDRK